MAAANKMWGGRFSSETDELFSLFSDSLQFDRELLEADVEGSLAYARALERAGVFSRRERRSVEKGLEQILAEYRRNPESTARSGAEDIHSWVEARLVRKTGSAGLRLHTGRSRNDQVALDLRLYLRKQCLLLEDEIGLLLGTLTAMAETGLDVVMPAYTHMQKAQPVLWSHYLLAYAEMFLRDRQRLREARARASSCPLGSGAVSGTAYGIDRARLARDLGFAEPSRNSMDAVSDRDFVLDFLYFASVLHVHFSRLAEDLVIFSSSEFGFVQLDDCVASGSSLMPQKKNPDALELLRGKSGRVVGHLVSLLTVLKGLPMTYNKDMQEDKEALFDAVRTATMSLRVARLVLEHTRLNRDRLRAAASAGHLTATDLADYLVARGMAFRKAHHLVGRIVLRALELGIELDRLPLAEYRRFSVLFKKDVYLWLDAGSSVARRREVGGTSPQRVRQEIARIRKKIGAARPGR